MIASGSPYVDDRRPVPGDLVEVTRGCHGGVTRVIAVCISRVPDVDMSYARRHDLLESTVYEFMMGGPVAAGARFKCLARVGGTIEQIWRLEVLTPAGA